MTAGQAIKADFLCLINFAKFATIAEEGKSLEVKDKRTRTKKWLSKLRNKYRLVFMNDETLEERFTFRLSRLNVFVTLGLMTIILIFLTSILIAFTPLREYIPGYTNISVQKRLYELQIKTDSIEKDLKKKDLFISTLKDIINGRDLPAETPVPENNKQTYSNIRIRKSAEDSLLRAEVESQNKYNLLRYGSSDKASGGNRIIGNVLFFTPMKGIITNEFDPTIGHFGIDLVAKKNETIKAILDGTVILSK